MFVVLPIRKLEHFQRRTMLANEGKFKGSQPNSLLEMQFLDAVSNVFVFLNLSNQAFDLSTRGNGDNSDNGAV